MEQIAEYQFKVEKQINGLLKLYVKKYNALWVLVNPDMEYSFLSAAENAISNYVIKESGKKRCRIYEDARIFTAIGSNNSE